MSYVLAMGVIWCSIGMLPPPEAPDREPLPQPEAKVEAIQPKSDSTKGLATYYAYHEGQAAAGPALRRMLGKGWRGEWVTVWRGANHVRVRLTDWCACGPRNGKPTIIDLDDTDFEKLAPSWRGVVTVRVTG